MHLEILVEDSSGEKLLKTLLPAIIGPEGDQCFQGAFALRC